MGALQRLNLPEYTPRIRTGKQDRTEIFDPVRKKFVRLTPEEWVRQHFLHYMTGKLGYPASLIAVEKELIYNGLSKRFDILAFRPDGSPGVVIECKAPTVEVTQQVFDQAAMYNMTLKVDFMVVTNGLTHYACHIDHTLQSYSFLHEIPAFSHINS